MRSSVLAVILGVLVGCGGGGGNNNDVVDPPIVDAPDNPDPDAPPIPPGFTRLIGRTWNLNPGQLDTYRCVSVVVPQDMYVTNIMAQAPLGTHHTVLSIFPNAQDGETNCGVGTLGMQMLYASGVGTAPLDFPAGVGVKLTAGQRIHLNLHLFNATDNPISGDSAILVKAQSTPPPMLAEMVFSGTTLVLIPANSTRTITGGCTVDSSYSLFAVWPHMHQIATHQKVELIRGGNTTVLHDMPYQFAEQNYYLQTPEVAIQQGDQLRVSCTFVNNTNQQITFGDSSNQEMCFSGLYRYPAKNNGLFDCTSGPTP